MPGVELTASVRDGHVVVVLCGDLDVTGAADAEAAITVRTHRHRPIVAVITTVSAAPAERDMPSTARSRLKHIVRRAEVFTDRLGALVSLRLPLAAG
jgi:siroheme synthase